MPRNGSGVYGPPAGTAAVPNTTIESADYNAVVADLAQALTDSVNVQGTAPFQASQPMGGNKLTGLGAGAANNDSATLGQVQSAIVAHAASVAGTADAITATFSPAFTAYTAKMRFRFTAGAANATTTPSLNVDGLGAKTIKKLNGAALAIGDISGSGHICDCVYNGTDVILLNPTQQPSIPTGGAKGQVLAKASATNFDAAWVAARAVLTADTTFYILTTGNDANDGLANTNGGAFQTIQAALDTIAAKYDAGGRTITVQIGDGAYSAGAVIPRVQGIKSADNLIIQGNMGTPANVTITATGADCFFAADGALATIQGVTLATASSGDGISATRAAVVKYGTMNFGSVASRHLRSSLGGLLKAISNYTINGNATNHFSALQGGIIDASGLAITLSGSRTFNAWANVSENAFVSVFGTTYTGSATGPRLLVLTGGGIKTGGTTQPGSSAGSTTTPGWES